MQIDGENAAAAAAAGNIGDHIIDVQKDVKTEDNSAAGKYDGVVSVGELINPVLEVLTAVPESASELLNVDSPTTKGLSSNSSECYECRICNQEKEEELIELGCRCRGWLSRTHKSCIMTWFQLRGSNICEICQQVADNVPEPLPQSQPWQHRQQQRIYRLQRIRPDLSIYSNSISQPPLPPDMNYLLMMITVLVIWLVTMGTLFWFNFLL